MVPATTMNGPRRSRLTPATERESVKAQVLRNVEAVVRPDAILATNTSSISITRLAASLKDPSRFVGMHFFNPVPMMALVEIISGLQTSQATFDAVTGLAKTLGQTPHPGRHAVRNVLLCHQKRNAGTLKTFEEIVRIL